MYNGISKFWIYKTQYNKKKIVVRKKIMLSLFLLLSNVVYYFIYISSLNKSRFFIYIRKREMDLLLNKAARRLIFID